MVNTYYFHLYTPIRHAESGSLTIRVDVETDSPTMYCTVARCSSKDHFGRKRGRAIADQKMADGKAVIGTWNVGLSILENADVVFKNEKVLGGSQLDNQEVKQIIALIQKYKDDHAWDRWMSY